VVKADGYGLGVGPLSRRLWDEGARAFFVARLTEGEALRAELGGRAAEIFVLDGLTHEAAAPRLSASALTPALTSLAQIEAWSAFAAGRTLPCAIHFDTGMNRLGIGVEQAAEAARLLAASPGCDLTLVMSHLSYATSPGHPRNAAQMERFRSALAHFPHARASLSASAGIFLGAEYRFDMVRPGISLFGGGPEEVPRPDLRAVAILDAPILQVRAIRARESVGYGQMFTAPGDMTVALVEAGYADGVLRTSYANGRAAVRGRLVPLVIVSMDLIAIDVSDMPDIVAGELVELLGPTALLDEVAAAANTVAHECLVRLSPRAERVYRD
jgi:alanine racemase